MTTSQDLKRVYLEALKQALACPTIDENAVNELCDRLELLARQNEG